jgi:hypothetical protein
VPPPSHRCIAVLTVYYSYFTLIAFVQMYGLYTSCSYHRILCILYNNYDNDIIIIIIIITQKYNIHLTPQNIRLDSLIHDPSPGCPLCYNSDVSQIHTHPGGHLWPDDASKAIAPDKFKAKETHVVGCRRQPLDPMEPRFSRFCSPDHRLEPQSEANLWTPAAMKTLASGRYTSQRKR